MILVGILTGSTSRIFSWLVEDASFRCKKCHSQQMYEPHDFFLLLQAVNKGTLKQSGQCVC